MLKAEAFHNQMVKNDPCTFAAKTQALGDDRSFSSRLMDSDYDVTYPSTSLPLL
jgi:hypothetical protein